MKIKTQLLLVCIGWGLVAVIAFITMLFTGLELSRVINIVAGLTLSAICYELYKIATHENNQP